MTTILITGATGTIGRRLVHTLTQAGHRPTVLLHGASTGEALGTNLHRVNVTRGDYADARGLRAALDQVDRLFLVSPNQPEQVDHECAVIDAAADAAVSRIVKVSAHGAAPDSPVAFWRWHAAIEDHLQGSGVPSISLRPMFSMANILGHAATVRTMDVLVAPAVRAPIAMVDPQDVADLAAHFLTADRLPEGTPSVTVSGPDGATFAEVVETISTLAGRPVAYHAATDDETRNYLQPQGTPPFVVNQILAIFDALEAGAQADPVDTTDRTLHRRPTDLQTFLQAHAEVFQSAVPAEAGARTPLTGQLS